MIRIVSATGPREAATFALPLATAAASPVSSTVATAASEDDQVTSAWAIGRSFKSRTCAESRAASPMEANETEDGVTSTEPGV